MDSEQYSHFYQTLFNSVEEIIEMPEFDRKLCFKYFEPVMIPKSTIIERAGSVPGHQYFIISGHMRNFYIHSSGEEVTTDMNEGPRFFTSYNSFMNRTVSNENIECITDCDLLKVTRDDVDILYQKGLSIKDYTMMILQKFLDEEKIRMKEMSTRTAEQRYDMFLKTCPSIAQNVPLKYIASYLGIRPESLSRIRRNKLLNKC
ncbi:Crp/Fnr family transcriptional regulator [Pleurocapsales cyanobacterium LEGE 10410]|nr:Crp/Fnr family transcriptional regulator [Pleurocapsales cyanobacterium LEGE 10410]